MVLGYNLPSFYSNLYIYDYTILSAFSQERAVPLSFQSKALRGRLKSMMNSWLIKTKLHICNKSKNIGVRGF